MSVFYYELKEKLDRKYIFLIYFLQLGILISYHVFCYHSDLAMYLQSIQGMQKSALIAFTCLTFFSYEIFCDFQRKEWRELLGLKRWGVLKTAAAKDFLLILLVVFEFAVLLIMELVKMMTVDGHQQIMGNVFRVMLLNYLCFPIAGIAIGKAAALLSRKRWSGYIWILVVLLLGCGLLERINGALYMTLGINLDGIFRFFQFEQPNSRWVVDYLYLIPAENYRFFLVGTWIAGCGALICGTVLKKKAARTTGVCVCLALCILLGTETAHPGNYVNYNLNYGTAAGKETEFDSDRFMEEVKSDFTVEKCSMDLHISDELDAGVVLTLGKESTKTYRFTLYRGYQILEMTDENGALLDYDREGDYITVSAPEKISEIHMSYHGYQQSFYSNAFGLMLPGYFAYYPQPGFRRVFLDDIVQTYRYYGFNTDEELLCETNYEIRVDYKGPVFSNLAVNDGTFSGVTVAPTLMGGNAAETFRKDGHSIYPSTADASDISINNLKESLGQYCEKLGLNPEPFNSLKHIIIVPSSVYIGDSWGKNIIVGDCLFLGTDQVFGVDVGGLAEGIVMQYMNVRGERDVLLNVMFDVLGDAMYLDELEPMNEEQFFSVSYNAEEVQSEEYAEMLMNQSQERMFLLLMDSCDEEEVFHQTAAYLMDPDAVKNSAEFMQALYLELNEK